MKKFAQLFSVRRSLTVLVVFATGGVVIGVSQALAVPAPLVAAKYPPITSSSGAAEIALAEHLTKVGAKMYGAYWCPHCHSQKQLFGKEAWQKVTYIECAEDGPQANPQACSRAKVTAYPTWQIKGKTYLGSTSLYKLAFASGYKGSSNFKNK